MRRFLLAALLVVSALGAGAQTIFNCSSGFAASGTCGVSVSFPNNQQFFSIGATGNASPPVLSGTQFEMAPPGAVHNAFGFFWTAGKVSDQAFQANYTYVPNGWNISFVLQNNTSSQDTSGTQAYGLGSSFSSGAGCEGSIFQSFPNGGGWNPPNNIFAVSLDGTSPLTDAAVGGAGFTYSGTQLYVQGQNPCNPNTGPELHYYFTKKISTSPVPLNSSPSTQGVPTGDTYSVTLTYTGSTVTEQLFDVTAGGSCPGVTCYTHTWDHISIPTLVDGTTAWVGLTNSTNAASGFPLLVNTFAYTVLSAAATPTLSPTAGTYGSTQSVTISDASTGSIICYNTTGNPSTNGIGACTNGTLYTGAISVAKGQTIYAVAGSGTSTYGDSAIGSAAYAITGKASSPLFSAATGTYNGAQTIILSASQGSVICYNTTGAPATNGTTGCTTGTLYTAPVAVSANSTLYAVAGGTGLTDSDIGSSVYVISPYWGGFSDSPSPANTPTFSPLPGTYSGAQTVTLSTSTANAYICYSLSSTPLTILPYPDSLGGCAEASISGTISGTTLTAATPNYGNIRTGMTLNGAGITPGTTITGQLTGTGTTEAGTYSLSNSMTVGSSETMYLNLHGTLYTGPITVSSNQYLYAAAGTPVTAYPKGTASTSSPTVGLFTINASSGTSVGSGVTLSGATIQ